MGFWDWLLGRNRFVEEPAYLEPPPQSLHLLPGSGGFEVHAVGESFYTAAFQQICGRPDGRVIDVTAHLRREPTNRHDKNAVAVLVSGLKVGHLGRDDAVRYKDLIERIEADGLTVGCRAQITAGWQGSHRYESEYSVRLDLPPPPLEAFTKWSQKIRSLKTSDARAKALANGLAAQMDEGLRERLRAEAAELEAERALDKIGMLKNAAAKRRRAEAAIVAIEAIKPSAETAQMCVARLRNAIDLDA